MVDSGGTSKVPADGSSSSPEQAPRASSVAADAIELRRKSRRDIPSRRAASSQVARASRAAARTRGVTGGGANSPFEQEPSLMGRPGSSSRSDRRTSADHPVQSGLLTDRAAPAKGRHLQLGAEPPVR